MDGISNVRKFIQLHAAQLVSSAVPEIYWETLCRKLSDQIFDAGEAFSLYLIDYSESERKPADPVFTVAVSKDDGIKRENPNEIYIIDHAWTFRFDRARAQLRQIPQLLNRTSIIMGIDAEELSEEENINQVLSGIWKYCQMYALGGEGISVEDRMPIWYIMDEFGCAVNHSDSPNFRIVPFMYLGDQITYSIMFPLEDCEEGTYVTRDYVEGTPDNSRIRNALLLPWRPGNFTDVNYVQHEPDQEYFLAGHIEETLPETVATPNTSNLPLKVYSTYRFVNEYLTDTASFQLVDNADDADVLWLTTPFKNYKEFSQSTPNKFINQFPFEFVLTIKDLLGIVCRRMAQKHSSEKTLETYPQWLPTTFNLKTELLEFVSYYQNREKLCLDNHWIIKPWNLARGLDMHITNDLSQIMRLQPTGPKIAQKYLENPVLFHRAEIEGRVKFDVRYVILLHSIEPLRAYIYRNFFLRFANKAFALDRFDDYEQHFTVMNYAPDVEMRHLPCAEFLDMWSQQYPKHSWEDIECDIGDMLKEMLLGATSAQPPCGIGHSSQSRALYAADIMLTWNEGKMQPKLLEVNWTPDCKRACEYYPQFYNDVFKLLFLNQPNEDVFKQITST